jgi:hypothetical protein
MSLARLRALVIVAVLVVCAAVLVAVALVKDRQAGSQVAAGCGPGDVPADLRLPVENTEVKINVFNATDSPGLARQVADEFRSRKVTVVSQANDPAAARVAEVAVLRFGPRAVGKAHLIGAYFFNEAKPEFDINRDDDVVDVVLGTKFKQLASSTEVNQALVAVGSPRLPVGTCDANAR